MSVRAPDTQATALEAEEFLTRHNFRPLVEWMTAEIVLNRPSDPFPFLRGLLDSRIRARGPRGYDPAAHTDYLQDCYANASEAFEAAVLSSEGGDGVVASDAEGEASAVEGGVKVTATRRAAVLDAIVDASSTIAKCTEAEDVARVVRVQLAEIIHADAVVVHLMNTDATLLFEVRDVRDDAEPTAAPKVVVGKGIIGNVGQSGATLYLTKASAHSKYAGDADAEGESVISAALRDAEGAVSGTVTATSVAAGGFTPTCMRVVESLLTAAGSAFVRIANRKAGVFARQQLDATKRALHTLDRIAVASDEAEAQDLVGLLTSALALVCGADACTLWVLTRDGQRLISAGVSSDAQGSRVLQLSEGLAGACASSDATVVVDGASADPRWDAEKEEQSSVRTESALCVPVRAKGGAGAVVGVAQILKGVSPAATSAVHFSTEEQALVNMIVHAAGAVIAVSAMWAALCASSAAACAPHRTAGSPSSFISFPFVSFPSTELSLSLSLRRVRRCDRVNNSRYCVQYPYIHRCVVPSASLTVFHL